MKNFKIHKNVFKAIGLDGMSKEERTQRRRALSKLGIPSFSKFVKEQQQMGMKMQILQLQQYQLHQHQFYNVNYQQYYKLILVYIVIKHVDIVMSNQVRCVQQKTCPQKLQHNVSSC